MNFRNKVVLITGGSRGIGKAAAIAFAKSGAKVIINFRANRSAANETMGLLEGRGHMAIKADIDKPTAIEKMVKAIIGEFGSIDVLIFWCGVN